MPLLLSLMREGEGVVKERGKGKGRGRDKEIGGMGMRDKQNRLKKQARSAGMEASG